MDPKYLHLILGSFFFFFFLGFNLLCKSLVQSQESWINGNILGQTLCIFSYLCG